MPATTARQGVATVAPAIQASNGTESTNPVYAALSSPANRHGAALEFGPVGGGDYSLVYNHFGTGWWGLDFAGLDAGWAFCFCDNAATAFSQKYSSSAKAFLYNGAFLGGAGASVYVAAGPVAPTAGSWAVGDRVLNSAPTAGGNEGWVCVTAGSPGTWKSFGSIAP